MKKNYKYKVMFLITAVMAFKAYSQLTTGPGSYWNNSGSIFTVLSDVDLINNGNFLNSNNTIKFSGNTNNNIAGVNTIVFDKLEIAKNGANTLFLQNNCSVNQSVLFTSGLIDLNSRIISMAPAALLNGESEASRITGLSGGYITITNNLNAPAAANPGNLGAIITSSQNLGSVTINRGHQAQTIFLLTKSINRYFDINPTNNTALNATLRFRYFDAELNGINENAADLFKSNDYINWQNMSYTTRDGVLNYVERAGIASFSRWTLSDIGLPLPVTFVSLEAECNNDAVHIKWKTAQELNIAKYSVQKSADGVYWNTITSLPPANNNNSGNTYTAYDNNSSGAAYYRIAETDNNGNMHYSNIIRSSCSGKEVWKLWPNPFVEEVFLQIGANNPSLLSIKVFDATGRLVSNYHQQLKRGINQVTVDMKAKASGTFLVVAEWDNGRQRKTVPVIKQ